MSTTIAPPKSRRRALAEIRAKFISKGYPRLVVLTCISLSGLAAFGASTALFRLGLDHMGVRYVAATAVGYAVFLLLIRAWIALNRSTERSNLDVLDLSGGNLEVGGGDAGFSGGASGGGGASADWGGPDLSGIDVVDADEAWPVVLAIAVAALVLLGAAIAALYVVYYAPVLLAEIALDAALVTGIYRRLRKQDTGHWLGSAIRHTWKPALVIAACFFVVGVVVQWAMPTARTIGDVLR